jgi:hypothetical protein
VDAAHFGASIGPASSTGSPMTFMMRPRHAGPTGTMIGEPVSVTSWPRTRPSVESIAMVRTVFSPRCWATSSTRRLPTLVGLERVQDRGQVIAELHVDDGADDLRTLMRRLPWCWPMLGCGDLASWSCLGQPSAAFELGLRGAAGAAWGVLLSPTLFRPLFLTRFAGR